MANALSFVIRQMDGCWLDYQADRAERHRKTAGDGPKPGQTVDRGR